MADIRIKDLPETLDVGAGDYVAVDNANDGTRKFTLRQLVASVGGGGLTQTEKNLILTLLSKAAYAESDAESAYDALENLWMTTTRTITYNLSYVSSSNTTASIESGQSYATTLTPTGGYALNTVTVTMGGVDITSTTYSSGTISIPSVTGNIVITATAVLAAQSITATYTQSGTVYNTDSLSSLKADLVVTANYSGGTSETVPSSDYTLSGTLAAGTSTITVSYAGLTDTFDVTVSAFSTEPSIAAYNSSLNSSGSAGTIEGACYTNAYEFELDVDAIKETQYYDATNNYLTTGGVMFQIRYYTPDSVGISFGSRGKTCQFDSSGGIIAYSSPNKTAEASIGDSRQQSKYFTLSDNIVGIKFSLATADIDDSYAYYSTTLSGIMPIGVRAGDIIFAGRNTQYYGKRNIND